MIIIGLDYAIQIDENNELYNQIDKLTDNATTEEIKKFCEINDINFKELKE